MSHAITKSQLERFIRLFTGYTQAFGQYQVASQESSTGKNVGPRSTKSETLTPAHYQRHLEGSGPGLGVIMLDESNCVRFAAADVDNYRLDLPELERRVKKLRLPLVLCRTKSGGAHLYLFLSEPVQAELVRTKMAEWVSALNLSNRTEVFPKQSNRANPSDIGSWINLPYQNAFGPTMRYALLNGHALELDDFLDTAEYHSINLEALERIQLTPDVQEDELDPLFEAPPCLVTINQQGGFAEGTRNDGMMAVGVYLKKRFEKDWESKFAQYNKLFCKPMIDQSELDELISSLRKKDYFYRCKQPPIHSVCQQRACVKRQFGVGGGGEGNAPVQLESLAVNGLVQYSYPGETAESLWALEMCNVRMMVTTDTLLNPVAMVSKLVETGRVLPAGMSQLSRPKWHKYLEPILANSERLDMSLHTGAVSPLWESVLEILKSARRARSQEHFFEDPGMLMWQEGNTLMFTFGMLRRFLNYRSRKAINEVTLALTLESYGATRKRIKNMDIWLLTHQDVINSDASSLPEQDAF